MNNRNLIILGLMFGLTACSNGEFTSLPTGGLNCTVFDEGLKPGTTVTYKCVGTAVATYYCLNAGDNVAGKAKAKVITGVVEGSQPFTVDSKGTVAVNLDVPPPKVTDFSCPEGQSLELGCVVYSGVKILDSGRKAVGYSMRSVVYNGSGFECPR